MNEQSSFFSNPDMKVAQAAREEAISRVDENADVEWKERAYGVLLSVAKQGRSFTADDVWEGLDSYPEQTHEPSALGPIFLRASRAKLIRKTGRLVPSRHARRHRDLTEWVIR